MQTLKRFWHWQKNELPDPDLSGAMLDKNLSPLAKKAVVLAQEMIARRALPKNQDEWAVLMGPLEKLSLAICETLEVIPERSLYDRDAALELIDLEWERVRAKSRER